MKLIKKIIPKKINQLVYFIDKNVELPELKFKGKNSKISINKNNKLTNHKLFINDNLAYRSNTHIKTHLMKCINKYNYPVIGDCYTYESFRGKSIYPYMLQKSSIDALQKNDEVYVLVSPDNISSIKGIEKSGFILLCNIQAIRIGYFFVFKKITYNNNV